jgi:hypothetical protein
MRKHTPRMRKTDPASERMRMSLFQSAPEAAAAVAGWVGSEGGASGTVKSREGTVVMEPDPDPEPPATQGAPEAIQRRDNRHHWTSTNPAEVAL